MNNKRLYCTDQKSSNPHQVASAGKRVPAIFQSTHATGKETELNMRQRTQEKVIDFSRYKFLVTKRKTCLAFKRFLSLENHIYLPNSVTGNRQAA